MTDGFTLTAKLNEAMEEANRCISQMVVLGEKKAAAERQYRIEKQRRILYERDRNNTPVSIIADVVKGYQDIAELAFNRDCAEAEYDANFEAVLYWKKVIDVLRETIAREWGRKE